MKGELLRKLTCLRIACETKEAFPLFPDERMVVNMAEFANLAGPFSLAVNYGHDVKCRGSFTGVNFGNRCFFEKFQGINCGSYCTFVCFDGEDKGKVNNVIYPETSYHDVDVAQEVASLEKNFGSLTIVHFKDSNVHPKAIQNWEFQSAKVFDTVDDTGTLLRRKILAPRQDIAFKLPQPFIKVTELPLAEWQKTFDVAGGSGEGQQQQQQPLPLQKLSLHDRDHDHDQTEAVSRCVVCTSKGYIYFECVPSKDTQESTRHQGGPICPKCYETFCLVGYPVCRCDVRMQLE
jgi:hypothetical protein